MLQTHTSSKTNGGSLECECVKTNLMVHFKLHFFYFNIVIITTKILEYYIIELIRALRLFK